MQIRSDFIGGNIRLVNQTGTDVYLENELRDTIEDWFYWAFCVEGVAEQTLCFHFQKNRLGYWGPAVSHDLVHWHWLGDVQGDCFTYTFSQDENKVYFAHHMLYHPDRFFAFCRRHEIEIKELCRGRLGTSVPCITLGSGDQSMILTARHHACESTGNYVLEGVLEQLLKTPLPNTRILCVPFVDYDGVLNGDQGKARAPYDHNRDYLEPSIYPETKAIREYADRFGCHYGFDFHSPWHKGKTNDTMFVVRNREDKTVCFDRFSILLESELTPDSMKYKIENDYPVNTGWNFPKRSFGIGMHRRPECKLAHTLESTYFGTSDNQVQAERLVAFGRAYARAILKYEEGELR